MDRHDVGAYYSDNIGLVHEAARKGFARLMELGVVFDYDDLFQEMSEVFIRAYNGYNPNKMKFSTYFMVAASNRVSKMVKKFCTERANLGLWSIEDLHGGDSEGDSISVEESLPSQDPLLEDQLVINDQLAKMKLSPVASIIVELLIDPPDFLEREIEAARAFAGYARSRISQVKRQYSKRKDRGERQEFKKIKSGNVKPIALPRSRQNIGLNLVCDIVGKAISKPQSVIRAARREVERKFGSFANA